MRRRHGTKLEERVTIADLARTYDQTLAGKPVRLERLQPPRRQTTSKPRSFTVSQGDVRLTRLKARADGIRFALQYENQTAAQSKVLRQILQNLELAIRGMEATLRQP